MAYLRQYSDEHCFLVARLLTMRLRRSPMVKDWVEHGCRPCHGLIWERFGKWHRFLEAAGVPLAAYTPEWGKTPPGGALYWTHERIKAGMRSIRAELGYFPQQVREYNPLKVGRMDWPPDYLIRGLGKNGNGKASDRSAWRNAMVAAGLGDDVEDWNNGAWTDEDDTYLLERAGTMSLKRIAFNRGRTYAACRRRLYDLGTRARDARGLYTASVLAQELNCPLTRVLEVCHAWFIDARKPTGVYYQINPDSLTPQVRAWLTRPRITRTSFPPYTKWTHKPRRKPMAAAAS